MRKVILYAAQSIDGFIASPDGSVDWLFSDQDYGYSSFYKRIDTTLIGRTTYEQILTFGPFPYHNKRNLVFSSQSNLPRHESVEICKDPPQAIIETLRKQPGNDIWLVGGARLNTAVLSANLVDELILAVHPIVLGDGIPLTYNVPNKLSWSVKTVTQFSTGMVILCYDRRE